MAGSLASAGTPTSPILTKEDIIPFKYRIVGPKKIMWLFDITPIHLPMLPHAKNLDGNVIPNRYDIVECCKVLLKTRMQKRATSSVAQLEIARVRKLSVEVEREVLKNEMFKGSIVRLEDADAEVIDMILALRSKLLGFPSHVGRLILGKEDFDEVVRILTTEMKQALKDLKSLDFEAVRARNGKLAKQTDFMSEQKEDPPEEAKNPVGRPRKDAT